jgi:ribosomal protein L11 methyltransferase
VDAIVGDAWRDAWKKYFEPFRLADGIVVSPPWRPYEARSGERVITLEPGRAFGTGLHETTALVAQVLADRADRYRGAPILDVGCGSGILSLVALTLGASRARALDVDPDAVLVTRENAARNGLAQAVVADDAPLSTITDRYEVVVANIEASILVELAPSLTACVAPGGLLVLSGILSPGAAPLQVEQVRRAFRGLHDEEVRTRGEWVAVVLGG